MRQSPMKLLNNLFEKINASNLSNKMLNMSLLSTILHFFVENNL